VTSAVSIREVRASAESDNFWTASTTATTSVIAADVTRVGLLIVNRTTGRIYLRFDTTAPTAATNGSHWFLETDERWEVPEHLTAVVVSVIATIASGHVVFHMATAA
jgi:hypothetical protein